MEENEQGEDISEMSPEQQDKLEMQSLKDRANLIGLRFHPKIGLKNLRIKVEEHLNKTPEQLASTSVDTLPDTVQSEKVVPIKKVETLTERKIRLRKKASRLVRIRLTCMNPNKRAWQGEVFTVSNSSAGTFKKFVPFNADNGWHIPQMMLGMIEDRKYVEHYVAGKDSRGREIKRHRLVKEFAIEKMPPLTEQEIHDLKIQQGLANNLSD